MMATDFLEYPEVLQEVRGLMYPGRLKLQQDKVIFRNSKTGRIEQIPGADIEKVNWLLRAKGHCLKITTNSGAVHRFDGFRDLDFDQLSNFVKKSYKTGLEKIDMCLKGWNWGNAMVKGNNLEFYVDNKPSFDVPLNYVSQTTTGKNEVTLEFHLDDDADVALTEMRFHIPSEANAERDPVEEFHEQVLNKADIIQVTGNALTTFDQVHCLTPRGRYDLKLYPTFMQLHGRTFDYKIPYTTILRLFLLPYRDGRQMHFVIYLDPPIKQGQTRYHFLIFSFNKEDQTELQIAMNQKQLDEKFGGKLQQEMSGPEYEVISRIMKALTGQKITVPGSFIGHSGSHAVACSYRASTGFLYPLEKGFIFVHKPSIYIRFDEISHVNFARSAGGSLTRSFDFEVETKADTSYTFVGIEKDEYGKLFDYVRQKKLRVKNTGEKKDDKRGDDMSSSEEEHDAYLQRVKNEAREREMAEDEDDEEDEDFVAPESGSEVDEEFDTDAASSSSEGGGGEGGEEGGEKKKKKKKTVTIKEPGTKKEKKEKTERRKKKKQKDPNAPKRPPTAYILWFNEIRDSIKKEDPTLSLGEVGKKAGELWRNLGDKTKWEKEVKRLKEKYEEAMKSYVPPPSSPSESQPSKKKKKSIPASDVSPTKSGSGPKFKSKEFLSEDESSGSETEAKSKRKKPKKDSKTKPAKQEKKKEETEEEEEEEEEDTSSKPRSSRRGRGEPTSDLDELPSEEEILSSPEHSVKSASGGESGGGSDEDAGSEDDE